MQRIRLSSPRVVGGSRVEVQIAPDRSLRRYVASSFAIDFDTDVTGLSEGILGIPCVALLAPTAWVLDATIEVPSLDERYHAALGRVRDALATMYPDVPFTGSVAAERLTSEHPPAGGGSATLFSGGIDSWATLVAHEQERPALLTVLHRGDLDDGTAERIRSATRPAPGTMGVDAHEIVADVSEVTDFSRLATRFDMENWWGNVLHGLGLTGVSAPLVSLLGAERLYVPSSNYPGTEWLAWGSDPRVDDEIEWGASRARHDLYELGRQGKLSLLAEYLERTGASPLFQVCQLAPRPGMANCSACEKCRRTIVGLRLAGIDPARVGLVDGDATYAALRRGIEAGEIVDTDATLIDWAQIQKAARTDAARAHAAAASPAFAEFARWLADAPLEAITASAKRRGMMYRHFKRASLALPNPVRRPLRRTVVRLRGQKM